MNQTTGEGGLVADAVETPRMSVIIPAFNEAGYIPETLDRLGAAARQFKTISDAAVQTLVVDNASTDRTAELAQSAGATVVHEAEHNIARVRNAGAAIALHDVLIFLDADTLIPPELLLRIARAMTDPMCVGGAVDCLHQPSSLLVQAYLKFWRVLGLIGGMAQGGCQFCRRSVFQELGGYDETGYMGEDVDFYWRLKRLARQRGLRTSFIRELQVIPSPRRWDRWPCGALSSGRARCCPSRSGIEGRRGRAGTENRLDSWLMHTIGGLSCACACRRPVRREAPRVKRRR